MAPTTPNGENKHASKLLACFIFIQTRHTLLDPSTTLADAHGSGWQNLAEIRNKKEKRKVVDCFIYCKITLRKKIKDGMSMNA